MTEYLWVVQLDIPPELEADFNVIYDTQHIPNISNTPGVLDVRRYVLEKPVQGVPKYTTLYRLTSPDLPYTPEWIAASAAGDWQTRIRTHVMNTRRAMYRAIDYPVSLPVGAGR